MPVYPTERRPKKTAIYHCSIKIIKRSQGRSAVAAAAYRSGQKLTNEWDGITHDYTKKGGVVYSEILLPAHVPPEFSDRSTLWNSVEKSEKSRNAQLAREIEIALPAEIDRQSQIRLVRKYVKDIFVSSGMCADFSIHDKGDGNPHAHIMLTIRPLKESGEWGAKLPSRSISVIMLMAHLYTLRVPCALRGCCVLRARWGAALPKLFAEPHAASHSLRRIRPGMRLLYAYRSIKRRP